VPGTGYRYSNVGYGLLGHALARAAGMSYRDLSRERVFRPLGMNVARGNGFRVRLRSPPRSFIPVWP